MGQKPKVVGSSPTALTKEVAMKKYRFARWDLDGRVLVQEIETERDRVFRVGRNVVGLSDTKEAAVAEILRELEDGVRKLEEQIAEDRATIAKMKTASVVVRRS